MGSSARKTGLLMFATLSSRLLGFVRIGIINFLFGASAQADIIHSVFNIPNNLRKLLAEGALSAAFVPVLSRTLLKNDEGRGRKIVENLLAFQLLILFPLLLLSAIFPELVISVLLDFSEPETLSQAAALFRYLVHYILLVSFSAVLMGALNSNEEFTIPGLTPLLFSSAVIISLLLFQQQLGIFAMAVGVLGGGIAQICFQLPKFLRLGYRFRFSFRFNNPDFRHILRNWLPILASSAIFVVNQLIAYRFASGMESGSATALSNAIVFWQLPYGIFSASIITVLFPRMSKEIAGGMKVGQTINFGISALMTFLLPASLGLMLMAPELISAALQRGAFLVGDTALAAEVLFWYSPGLVFVGINTFLQRLHFADDDMKTPIINALLITFLDILLSLWLKETALRVRGLALANTLSYALVTSLLLFKTKKRFPDLRLRPLFYDMLKIMAAVLPACFIMVAGRSLFGTYWESGSSLLNIGKFLAIALPAAASVLIMLVVFRLEAVYLFIKTRGKNSRP